MVPIPNFYGKSYKSADIKRMIDEYMIRCEPFQRYPLVYSDERRELAAGGPSRFPSGKSVNENYFNEISDVIIYNSTLSKLTPVYRMNSFIN